MPEVFRVKAPKRSVSGGQTDNNTRTFEEIELEQEILRLKLACHSQTRDHWWENLGLLTLQQVFCCWTRDNEEWDQYLRDMVSLYVSPPKMHRDRSRQFFFLHVLCLFQGAKFSPNVRPLAYAQLEEMLQWMREQKDDTLTLGSYMIKVYGSGKQDIAAAREALAFFLEKMPLSHPDRNPTDTSTHLDFIYSCIETIKDPKEGKNLFASILDPMLEARDVSRLGLWLSYQQASPTARWWNIVDDHMSRQEALAWLKRAMDRVALDWRPSTEDTHRPLDLQHVVSALRLKCAEMWCRLTAYEVHGGAETGAIKDMKNLERQDSSRVADALARLESNMVGDVKKLTNFTPEYRLRVGPFRVLFEIEDETRIVVYRVVHRREAYR